MITAAQLVRNARTWLGVPFVHQGRSRHGVDCIGLQIANLAECDALPVHFRDVRTYGRRPNGELLREIERYCTPADRASAGVLIVIRWPQVKLEQHVALCTGPTMIHAYQGRRGVIEHGYVGEWIRNTVSLWRLPGVTYE